ncbi:hypothetical protein RK487_02375 [Streptococcus pneumoniae]|nr:hypothetical protein [Streptococcus pneumoniae]
MAVAGLSFFVAILQFCNFAHFCALVCKIGFLFFNFPCFCTIDPWDGVAIGECGGFFYFKYLQLKKGKQQLSYFPGAQRLKV